MIGRVAFVLIAGAGCVVQPAPATPAQSATSAQPAAGASSEPDRATATFETATLTVPDFTGKTAGEAQAIAHNLGFAYDVEVNSAYLDCEDPPKPGVGKVTCQKPKAGEVVKRDTTLYVSTQAENE